MIQIEHNDNTDEYHLMPLTEKLLLLIKQCFSQPPLAHTSKMLLSKKKNLHVVKTFIMIVSDESENKLVIQGYLFLASFMKINSKSMNKN